MEHVNCCAVVPMGPLDTEMLNRERAVRGMNSGVSFRLEIFNSMSFDVFVIDRHNVKYRIPRSSSAAKGKLAFIKGYGLSPGARLDIKNISTTDDVANSQVLAYLLEKWAKNTSPAAVQTMHSVDQCRFEISEEKLRARKSMYLRDMDFVVCLDPTNQNHPYSHQGQLLRRTEELNHETGNVSRFFTWSVLLIDNAGVIGPRWINLFGQVHRIRSGKDPNSRDGFYVVKDKHHLDGVSRSERISDFIESEEELDFPVYKTYQEALAANDSESMIKLRTVIEERKIRELDLETRHSRAVADADKLRDDIAQQLRKNEEAERAHEREMQAIRETVLQERAKAEHERNKFERDRAQFEHDKITQGQKNAGETLKVIGAVMTGVIGLLAIAIKWLK